MRRLTTIESVRALAAARGWRYTAHHPALELRYELSKTTLEGFQDFLAHADEWIRTQDTFSMQRRTPRAARAFGRLYAYTTYPIAECFSCEIPDAILIGDEGVVSTPDGELLVESHVHKGAIGTRVAVTRAQPNLDDVPRLAGTYVSLRAFSAANYCHWLLDCLTRCALVDALPADEPIRFVLPATLKQFHLDSLRVMGISDDQMVRLEGPAVQVERLLMCRTSPEISTPYPAVLFAMTERIKRTVRAAAAAGAGRRLYVSRANAARVIVNEAELTPVLDDFGFERVRCERLSFAEQVRLFAQASVVLGPHGAGLINHIFSPAGTTVIELFNPIFFSDNVQRLSALYGQPHWHLYGVPVESDGINDMSLEPDKLRRLLDTACPP